MLLPPVTDHPFVFFLLASGQQPSECKYRSSHTSTRRTRVKHIGCIGNNHVVITCYECMYQHLFDLSPNCQFLLFNAGVSTRLPCKTWLIRAYKINGDIPWCVAARLCPSPILNLFSLSCAPTSTILQCLDNPKNFPREQKLLLLYNITDNL